MKLQRVDPMKSLFNLVIAVAFLLPLADTKPARAESASDFLKSIEGSYSGRGKAKILGEKRATVACKIKNSYSSGKLSISGECASTQGKGKIKGGIKANGNKLTGTFLSPRPNVTVTQSSGRMSDGKLVLSASMMNNSIGKLNKIRQVISKTSSGIKAEFYLYDRATRTYKLSGSMKLKRR